MEPIEWHAERHAPIAWNLLPDVDDVRPKACPGCGTPAKRAAKVVLHGHGVRWREVLVGPALDRRGRDIGRCWSRRYRCVACDHTCTVLPVGVLPRFLYSVFAVVVAFALIAAEPLGAELPDCRAYARQGMNPVRATRPGVDWQWRSIARWRHTIPDWWPAAVDIPDLLIHLARRAGSDDLRRRLEAAVRSHVRWGMPM